MPDLINFDRLFEINEPEPPESDAPQFIEFDLAESHDLAAESVLIRIAS